MPALKTYQIGLLVTHKNGYLGVACMRARRLKGKGKGVLGKGVLGARETRGAREEGGRETSSSLFPRV